MVYGSNACLVVCVAVGEGVIVGVDVAGMIVTFGGGKVPRGDREAEEQAARKIKKNRQMRCFIR